MAASCAVCSTPFPPGSRSDRVTCSTTCRVRRHNARHALRRDVAFDLLMRQTRAVQDGDLAALAALTVEAERLLGA